MMKAIPVAQQKHVDPELQKRLNAITANRGMLKGKSPFKTEAEWQKARREAGEAFLKKLDKKFGLTNSLD